MPFRLPKADPWTKKRTIEHLRVAQPVVRQAMLDHCNYLRETRGPADATLHSRLEPALAWFGDSRLTGREPENPLHRYLALPRPTAEK